MQRKLSQQEFDAQLRTMHRSYCRRAASQTEYNVGVAVRLPARNKGRGRSGKGRSGKGRGSGVVGKGSNMYDEP